MIIAVCSDKGSPGVTTLATALALVWPGQRLLLEADVAGGDLAFRARRPDSDEFLPPGPTIVELAAASRLELPPEALPSFALPTSWGVPVVQAPPALHAYAPLRGLWPGVAREAARWSGTVIADLGRLQPGHPGIAIARVASVVLVLGRDDVAGLHHLRERVLDLSAAVGDTSRARNPVGVVVRSKDTGQRQALRQVVQLLSAAGSPVPVIGGFAEDPAPVTAINSGKLTRKASSSRMLNSVRQLTQAIMATWPEVNQEVPVGGRVDDVPPDLIDLTRTTAREVAR